jgi:hypothetical protein
MITDEQTIQIREYLIAEKFTDRALADDLNDHLCCEIESLMASESLSFERAFEIAKEKVFPEAPIQVQHDLKRLITKTPNIMIKKIAYIGGYVSSICLIVALALFTLSSLTERRLELARFSPDLTHGGTLSASEQETIKQPFDEFWMSEMNEAFVQLQQSQTFFIIAILIFAITYLPYRFYSGFQKSGEASQFA